MAGRRNFVPQTLRNALRQGLIGPQALAFLPALALGAFWLGGEGVLIAVALGIPLLVLFAGSLGPPLQGAGTRDAATGLQQAEAMAEMAEDSMARAAATRLKTACFAIEIEEFGRLAERVGPNAAEMLIGQSAARLETALRDGDRLFRIGEARFGVVLPPMPRLDLETGIQMATRLQTVVEEPLAHDGQTIYLSVALGFCLSSRSPDGTGKAMIDCAGIALDEARRSGASAVRAYSPEMGQTRHRQDTLCTEVQIALENGDILPWFQPQISTDTGHVTGFETLARWLHPERGLIPPTDFLPALHEAGQIGRLGEVMLYGALTAVNAWDAANAPVPTIAVNMTGEELRNPQLADRLRWELDRFDLAPDRLTIEVLESVVAGAPEDMAARNLARLSELGCRIDLDDFGAGHASLAALRRFAIGRIKIDRSFITHVDHDPEQQRMVNAILTMADRLGIETLAEGVETAGEHTMLAQLGCRHVQGFAIGRPMPFDATLEWMQDHAAKLGPAPRIGRRSG
ncbi:putative bifunctional diguanylate cyclase/phosphodiesterase [Aquicoccus sp.]|uniref:putative bifunctional diguanylate cyclase/phosphodiesterase n=1 Tax=Aquicoccus sp. TaxID=2055851 RepID=UPI0035630A63